MTWTMPISTPVSLRTSASGSSIRPIAISALFTGPSPRSSVSHANERTSTEIQNGSSTQNSMIRCRRPVAARSA